MTIVTGQPPGRPYERFRPARLSILRPDCWARAAQLLRELGEPEPGRTIVVISWVPRRQVEQ